MISPAGELLFIAMRLFVAVTDKNWFELHASTAGVDEVNFWRPSPTASFIALSPGELLLFKLHSPDNFIVGGGFFIRFLQLPVNFAWDTFGLSNGVRSLEEMRKRIAHYRKAPIAPSDNPNIGCIILGEPFFWPRNAWIPIPEDFSLNIVQGKGYDSEVGYGKQLWESVEERLKIYQPIAEDETSATGAAVSDHGYGKPRIVLPRLGQGSFKTLLTDTYEKRCSISGERTVPVLDAAHITPYNLTMRHELSNGLLLRSDLHRLFDAGYISVDPKERRILVSRRIREEFSNGREYYRLEGQMLRDPVDIMAKPTSANLEYHAMNVFR